MSNRIIFNRHKFNQIAHIKYNSGYTSTDTIVLPHKVSRVGARPTILSQSMAQLDILENARNIILEQEVKGMDELNFEIDLTDSKRYRVINEDLVQMFDTIYIIRDIQDDIDANNTEVYCEARWYDIQYADPFPTDGMDWVRQKTSVILRDMLQTTGWKVGDVDPRVDTQRTIHLENIETNRLQAIRRLESHCGGELVFDTINMIVHMVVDGGESTGASIMYEKNAKNIRRTMSTKELITRIYAYGKDNMPISDANNGVPYLEDYSYTKKLRTQIVQDERYTNPYELKEMAQRALDELCKPQTSYQITMNELTKRSGLEHEDFFIGGIVKVYNKDLGLNSTTRIMKWKYNVSEPLNSDIELEFKAKGISDLLTGLDGFGDSFSQGNNPAGNITDLSVYNYLLNSRADFGMNYWQNTGWTVNPHFGGTGKASFEVEAELGVTKTLAQTVYPASRSAYTLSFKANTQNVVKGDGTMGIQVEVEFEDGTIEKKFVQLI